MLVDHLITKVLIHSFHLLLLSLLHLAHHHPSSWARKRLFQNFGNLLAHFFICGIPLVHALSQVLFDLLTFRLALLEIRLRLLDPLQGGIHLGKPIILD